MSLVKILNLLLVILIIAATFDLFFGIDSKKSFFELQEENRFLIEKNNLLSEENNLLEIEIQSRQRNDAHAERFAREELNLIYENEEYLSFQKQSIDEPKKYN